MDLDPDLDEIYQQIMLANRPEDLFGVEDVILPAKKLLEFLTLAYERFKSLVDPTRYTTIDDQEAATEANEKLERLYQEAQEKIACYHYGLLNFNVPMPHTSRSFTIGEHTYYLGNKLEDGSYYSLFQGYLERAGEYLGETVIKLAQDHQTNHLLQRELRAFDLLHKQEVPQWKHLPFVLDRFESAGRVGAVLRSSYGLPLSKVRRRKAHLKGVDQKHMVWMLDRTLSCLGYVHRCGIVHGGLTPDTIAINDRNHNAFVNGWEVSIHNPALTKEKVEILSDEFNPFVSPEVRERGEIGPWSDIYALGKIFIWLLGGDPAEKTIPKGVEAPIKQFLLEMVHENHSRRSADCWELYEEQCRIKDALWPRQFRHFDVS